MGEPNQTQRKTNNTVLILDESGSMGNLRKFAIDAMNEQIQTCRNAKTDFEKRISIITFNNEVHDALIWRASPENVSDITEKDFSPNGGTALYDAVGDAIIQMSDYDEEGATFLFCVISDGQENSSIRYDQSKLAELIQEKQNKGNWTFTYQGSDLSLDEIKALNIPAGNIMTVSNMNDVTAFVSSSGLRNVRTASYYSALGEGNDSVQCFYSEKEKTTEDKNGGENSS